MTTAPPSLLAVRALVRQHTGLSAAATGIVGDPAHRGGYHCGADRVVSGDYSVVESPRDRTGLADWACASDLGYWSMRVGGKSHDLRSFSVWLVAQCKAGTADTRDIREIIYSPDGTVVRRWDRLGKRSTGDSSHLQHTHISWFRDAIKAGRDQTPLFRRYFTEIGLIAPPPAPVPTPAPAITKRRQHMGERLIKMDGKSAVWLSESRLTTNATGQLVAVRDRVPLTDWARQAERFIAAGVPYIEVRDDAELTLLGGPARTPAS